MAYQLITLPFKDSDEVLDYTLDWSLRVLSPDFIDSSLWFIVDDDGNESPPDMQEETSSFGSFTTTIWLSGGTEDVVYRLTNRVTTDGGRIMDQSALLLVRAK